MDCFLIETFDQFSEFLNIAKGQQYVSFDIETDSVQEKRAKIYGMGFSFNGEEAYYIPIRKKSGESCWNKLAEICIYEEVARVCRESRLIGWNLIYDTLVFENNSGISISDYIYGDGILAKHMVDEERPFGLKETAVKYLGAWADKAQEALKENIKANGGQVTKDNYEMYKADTDVLAEYCCFDTILAYKLYKMFDERMHLEGLWDLYKDEVMPLYREVTIPMKREGFPIDVKYFLDLKEQIQKDIDKLELEIQTEIEPHTNEFIDELLQSKYAIKRSPTFAKHLANVLGVHTPMKGDKVTFAKGPTTKDYEETNNPLSGWMLELVELPEETLKEAQRAWYFSSNPESNYIFNLRSNDHLGWLLFEKLSESPKEKTETGKPKCDDDLLESLKDKYTFISKLIEYKKLMKLKSTYIEGILDVQVDGAVYSSMLQFGTTSGRYSSTAPNCQNLPRIKEDDSGLSELVLHYVNAIKRGFIAPKGYKLVNADYSALEPRCFAAVCGDKKLQDVFHTGEDLYSSIAINVFGVENVTAFEKDSNYLKKKHPELRQRAKVFCFTGDTKVEVEGGNYKKIKDIVVGDKVKTRNGFKYVLNTFKRDSKVIRFITDKTILTCTKDHKIWSETDKCFKEAEKFIKGEQLLNSFLPSNNNTEYQYLPIRANASFKNTYKKPLSWLKFDEEWGYLLGAFLGDGVGSYTRRKNYSSRGFNSHLISSYVGICGLPEDKVVEKFTSICENMGYKLSKRIINKDGNKPLCQNTIGDFEFSKIFEDTFNAISANEGARKNLEIQTFIYNSPLKVQLSFIAGLLDTDGYLKHNKAKNYSDVAFCSKDTRLISDLSLLLRQLGVYCSISEEYNSTYNRYYYLLRVSREGIFLLKELGLADYLACPRKKEAIERSSPARKFKNPNCTFRKLLEIDDERAVYDITVEEDHEFFANGILVHNCLAVVYGAEAGRISQAMNIDYIEAQQIIDMYLEAYPKLRDYMDKCNSDAARKGEIRTQFGRVRHLPDAKRLHGEWGNKLFNRKFVKENGLSDIRYRFKNQLNLAKNHPIQGMAAHIVNRAMIQTNRRFKQAGLDAVIIMTVHDEICCKVREDQVEEAAKILKDCMENTTKIAVPLKADPLIASTWADAK